MRVLSDCRHHGIVLNVSAEGFDSYAAAMGSLFICPDEPNKFFFFYSGSNDADWSCSSVGLAVSNDGMEFQKVSQPVLEGHKNAFCSRQALNPVVIRLGSTFYMILSGTPRSKASRRIGIAHADDPKGPWHVIDELVKPSSFWEGSNIDNGCSIIKLDDETLLLFYSSLTSPKVYDALAFVRRYPIRRIGILKVRVSGTSRSSIEAMRFNGNPLSHLNGPKGSWNESVFCPGYTKIGDTHFLFPAGSTYSVGFPYKQHIGLARGNSTYFPKEASHIDKLVDGPSEKTEIIPGVKSEIALDTPCPYVDQEKQKLHLYYSVADRADEKWKTALTTYDLHSTIE